jgi:hypothetical protein
MTPDTKTALGALNDLVTMSASAGRGQRDQAASVGETALMAVAVVAGLGLIPMLGIGRPVAGSIVRPLHRFREVLLAVGKGDLTRRAEVSGRDEVAEMATALGMATDRMRSMVGTVSASCSALASRSEEPRTASRNMVQAAERTSNQVADIDAATAGVSERIQSTVVQVDHLYPGHRPRRHLLRPIPTRSDVTAAGHGAVSSVSINRPRPATATSAPAVPASAPAVVGIADNAVRVCSSVLGSSQLVMDLEA